jgi:hypothetical protein
LNRSLGIPEPEAVPDPERKDGANGGNQELRRGIRAAVEKSGLHFRAQIANRADGERFLDSIAVELGLGNGKFGGRVEDGSNDHQENTG